MAKNFRFLSNFGKAMLFDVALFIIAMSIFAFFTLSSLGLAYGLAIVVMAALGLTYFINQRRKVKPGS